MVLRSDSLPIATHLAVDECLLNSGVCGYRIWTVPGRAVVLGVSSRYGLEADVEACRSGSVEILRRLSGGATVLVGPGVAAFSLYLAFDAVPESRSISSSYRYAASLLHPAFERLGIPTDFRPTCDISVGEKKLVGMAQGRRKKSVVVHGVIPVELDVADVERFVAHPPEEPEYRRGRSHAEFMTTVGREVEGCTSKDVCASLGESFRAAGLAECEIDDSVLQGAGELVERKYGLDEWNLRR